MCLKVNFKKMKEITGKNADTRESYTEQRIKTSFLS